MKTELKTIDCIMGLWFNLYYVASIIDSRWVNNGGCSGIIHPWSLIYCELSGILETDIKHVTAGVTHEGRQLWRNIYKRNF
jgi:hypothetical protein